MLLYLFSYLYSSHTNNEILNTSRKIEQVGNSHCTAVERYYYSQNQKYHSKITAQTQSRHEV